MSADLLDVEVFADRALGLRLWPHQVAAARGTAFITTIAAARRTGKSTLAEVMAAHTAFTRAGCVVLVISATEDSAKRLLESIGARLNSRRATKGAVVDDTKHRIDLGNGSRIVSLPASARQIRGFGRGVQLVIVDEAGFVPPEVWTAAHYTALDERGNGSRVLLTGTPWGGPDAFFRRAFEAGLAGDPDHDSHRWTYEVNPKLDGDYLRRQRDRVSPQEYGAEVLGEWSTAIGSLFPVELLENTTADFDLTPLAALRGPARVSGGLDFGASYDRSALVVVARLAGVTLDDGRPLFAVVSIRHWDAGVSLPVVRREVVASPARWWNLSPEQVGLGIDATQSLQEMFAACRDAGDSRGSAFFNPVATTSASKAVGYGAILGLLQEGQLVLPRHPDMLRQLAGIRTEQHERGLRIEAESAAVHDDLPDALAGAAALIRPEGGQWRSMLARAARRDDLPGFDLHGTVAEWVSTPAGVRVPRQPSLISILGPEVTEAPRAPKPGVAVRDELIDKARRGYAAALAERSRTT